MENKKTIENNEAVELQSLEVVELSNEECAQVSGGWWCGLQDAFNNMQNAGQSYGGGWG